MEYSCEAYLTRHLEYHFPSKEFICDVCGKVTHNNDTLQRHKKRVHTTKVAGQCKYCGKWYSSQYTLRDHILNMHERADEEHRCEICGFVSTTASAKRSHKRFRHNTKTWHTCHMCEKSFKTPTLLKEHLATHTGIDIYKCDFCESTFKSKSNKYTHLKRHHPVEYISTMRKRSKPTSISKYQPIDDTNKDE